MSNCEFIKLFDQEEAIALYAVTGKFSLNFIPNKFSIMRINHCHYNIYHKVLLKDIYGYVYDNFDFDDHPNQPVGSWNYYYMAFSELNSGIELVKNIVKKSTETVSDNDSNESIIDLYNKHYMNYRGVELSDNGKVNYKNNKIYKGLNFRVYSSQFFVIESTDGYEIKYIHDYL